MAGNVQSTGSPPPSAKTFSCPSCSGTVQIRAMGQSVAIACPSCGSIVDATNENYKIIQKYEGATRLKPIIPLGSRGRLHGTLWEVIGYMRRTDDSGVYFWDEYLLFNPTKGFRWLTEFDGHWNFIVSIHEKPCKLQKSFKKGSGVRVFDKDYTLFHKGKARVKYVLGEFYWQVKVGETVNVMDFILPPEILSAEESENESIWSLGEYIESDAIKTAFNIQGTFPYKKGVAPNQPSNLPYSRSITRLWAMFITIIMVLQVMTMMASSNEEISKNTFMFKQNDPEKVKISEAFELKPKMFSDTASLEFKLSADVNNNWLEVNNSLVNEASGETIDFDQGVEFYSGSDWTEGSKKHVRVISAVPSGRYHLNLEASGPGSIDNQDYTITVSRDVILWSNWIWSVLFISIFPLIVWWRKRSFEVSRWSTSDYSPYWSEDE